MEDDDAIPVIGLHRGVPLEDQQSPARLALVRREIDLVLGSRLGRRPVALARVAAACVRDG